MGRLLHCSFCGQSAQLVRKLVAGPAGVHICDECVTQCQAALEEKAADPARSFDPKTWPTERLLSLLDPVETAIEAHRRHLTQIVRALRTRGVSWAEIATSLGVSRQSAWERFS